MTSWDLDVPNLPFRKPKMIEELESFSREQREAMDPHEMEERAMEIARSLTEAYVEKGGKDYEKCMSIVKQALQEMGSAFGGLFGTTLISKSDFAARSAVSEHFPEAQQQ